MITFLLILGLGLLISIALNVFTFIIIKIQIEKNRVYEQWILDFKKSVETTLEEMKNIDKTGVFSTRINTEGIFEHDDQVGVIFKELEDLIEKLNQRTSITL